MPPSAKDKMAVMNESGQTEAERRELRHAQRSLQKTIADRAEALEDPNDEVFAEIRSENNQLWDQVRYTREAVLDGETLDMIAARAARQVDSLILVPSYDPLRLTQKLRQKCMVQVAGGGSSFFDWKTLGVEAGTCYNAVPAQVQFFHGPLHADYTPKDRLKRAPRQKSSQDSEEEEEEQPENVKTMATNADQLSAVERSMKVCAKVLKKRCRDVQQRHVQHIEQLPEEERELAKKKLKQEGVSNIDAVQYLFNPKSFTQTVENIFHFSFLVKQGSAGIRVQNGKPVVTAKSRQENQPAARQAIMALSLSDYREFCQAWNLQQGDIPHRTGSKHATSMTP